jgi:hypothetical protein
MDERGPYYLNGELYPRRSNHGATRGLEPISGAFPNETRQGFSQAKSQKEYYHGLEATKEDTSLDDALIEQLFKFFLVDRSSHAVHRLCEEDRVVATQVGRRPLEGDTVNHLLGITVTKLCWRPSIHVLRSEGIRIEEYVIYYSSSRPMRSFSILVIEVDYECATGLSAFR